MNTETATKAGRVPFLNIYRAWDGRWEWECWGDYCQKPFGHGNTHAEALAAALNHCAKAGKL